MNDSQQTPDSDPRVVRTRDALRRAFSGLVLARGYDAIRPGDVAAAAGVARSTFYEHFAGKPDLLRHAMRPVLQPLADAIDAGSSRDATTAALAHFRENRRLVRAVLAGRPRTIVRATLATLVEERLRARRQSTVVPLPLAAAQIAESQLGLVEAWLAGRDDCGVDAVVAALRATSVALAASLCDAW